MEQVYSTAGNRFEPEMVQRLRGKFLWDAWFTKSAIFWSFENTPQFLRKAWIRWSSRHVV